MTQQLALAGPAPQATARPQTLTEVALATIRQIAGTSAEVSTDSLAPAIADVGRITSAALVEIVEVSGASAGPADASVDLADLAALMRPIRRLRWVAGGEADGGSRSSDDSPVSDEFTRQWAPTLRQGGIVHGPVGPHGSQGLARGGGSVAVLPIQLGGKWWGMLVVFDRAAGRVWPEAELEGLRAVAAAAGAALHTGLVQARLAEIRARYQTLVEQIPAIIYIDLPQENRTAYVSPQIEPILGVTPAEWLTDSDLWVRMLHPADRDWVLAQYHEFVENDGPHLTEYRMMRPDGRVVWIRDRAQAVRDDQGHVLIEQGLMIDVTELKDAEATAQRHAALLERVDTISRQLTELVLQGGDHGQILTVLARVVENPVLLEDAAHQLIGFATHSAPVDNVLEAWDRHSRIGHPDNPHGVMVQDAANPRCAWIPLSIRGALWGRLHVLEVDTPLDDADKFPLDRAAAAISLALLSQRDAAHLSDQARSTLVSDIARGKVVAAGEIFRRARALGAELEGRALAGMVLELHDTAAAYADADLSEHERQRIRVRVLEESRQTLTAVGCTSLSGLEGDRILAVLGLPGDPVSRQVLQQAGQSVCQRVAALGEQLSLTVGFSRPSQRPVFGRLLKEAMEAASFGVAEAGRWPVHHFGELGVHHLLVRLAEGPELSGFVESELSPLLDYDATAKVPLLPTLAAYLEHGGRKAVTARALHLERRTLYFRIARIEKLLGRSLDDREVQLRCHLAIRGLELLKLRSPGHCAGCEKNQGRASHSASCTAHTAALR